MGVSRWSRLRRDAELRVVMSDDRSNDMRKHLKWYKSELREIPGFRSSISSGLVVVVVLVWVKAEPLYLDHNIHLYFVMKTAKTNQIIRQE